MVALVLSILCSSALFVIFKLYERYNIHNVYAIIVNYMVACVLGLWCYQGTMSIHQLLYTSWFWGPVAMGFLFVLIFALMAKTTQIVGITVTSLATKMALVIPVLFGVLWYQEKLSVLQTIGVVLALAAVYLASLKGKMLTLNKKKLLLPLAVFLGSGIIDIGMKYFDKTHLSPNEVPLFSALIFGFAALAGGIGAGIKAVKQPLPINTKDIVGGVVLAIPNYFSVFFILRALQNKGLSSSVVFTLNHVAIVLLTTLVGFLLFKEEMRLKNWLGLALAVFSIVLVALF